VSVAVVAETARRRVGALVLGLVLGLGLGLVSVSLVLVLVVDLSLGGYTDRALDAGAHPRGI
jgi:hypothetical protein